MKKIILIITFVFIPILTFSQNQYKISFDDYQIVEDSSTSLKMQMKFPFKDMVVVMGGLNDLDGMNNYFNIFGSKLIIEKLDITSNGTHRLLLRREDGRNFYDLFPTLIAKIIPISSVENEEALSD